MAKWYFREKKQHFLPEGEIGKLDDEVETKGEETLERGKEVETVDDAEIETENEVLAKEAGEESLEREEQKLLAEVERPKKLESGEVKEVRKLDVKNVTTDDGLKKTKVLLKAGSGKFKRRRS